ncbi:MAG: hypothetical protein K0U74_13135 [Alphaproteobacteria bacterium]|nr:hypothetical protein [Alphaproteobacteria bacterium]
MNFWLLAFLPALAFAFKWWWGRRRQKEMKRLLLERAPHELNKFQGSLFWATFHGDFKSSDEKCTRFYRRAQSELAFLSGIVGLLFLIVILAAE